MMSNLNSTTKNLIFINNKEGERLVRRKIEIYNLEATAEIMKQFSAKDFPDYEQIAGRIKKMREESFRNRYIDGRDDIPQFIDTKDISSSNMTYMYGVLKGYEIDSQQKRRRLIVDVVNDYIVRYYEDIRLRDEASHRGRQHLLMINRQSS